MGDVWPVPGGGEAASLLGTSPEQRKRSMPSGIREHDGSGWLRFPPLWETAVWRVMCGVWCVMCDVWCMLCCGVVVLRCVEVYIVLWCVMWCVCSFSLFAQAVCYSKREPNIKEYWEKHRKSMFLKLQNLRLIKQLKPL